MLDSDKKEFKKILVGLGEYYSKEITATILAFYFNSLKKFTLDQFNQAVLKHVESDERGSFFPKINELIKQITGDKKQNQLAVDDRAEIAWAEIMEKLSRVGTYKNLVLDDNRALQSLKAVGGWVMLGTKTYGELEWIKKSFIREYQAFERFESLASLPGIGFNDDKKQKACEQLENIYRLNFEKIEGEKK